MKYLIFAFALFAAVQVYFGATIADSFKSLQIERQLQIDVATNNH